MSAIHPDDYTELLRVLETHAAPESEFYVDDTMLGHDWTVAVAADQMIRVRDASPEVLCVYSARSGICCDRGGYSDDAVQPVFTYRLLRLIGAARLDDAIGEWDHHGVRYRHQLRYRHPGYDMSPPPKRPVVRFGSEQARAYLYGQFKGAADKLVPLVGDRAPYSGTWAVPHLIVSEYDDPCEPSQTTEGLCWVPVRNMDDDALQRLWEWLNVHESNHTDGDGVELVTIETEEA
jgi:hypothetical protein